jgi:formylglycine-generating enzyme required for sulfatase activity/tetratricopeptide (TPR) repeat protein
MRKTVIMAAAVAAAVLAGCGGKGTRGKAASEAANPYNIEMVFVEGGTFTMGCTEEQGEDCYPDTKPAHTVTVSSFYIGKYEVTQAQWKAVMGSAHNVENEGDDLPVDNVSWEDAQVFIRKLNAETGKVFRLPTEAEWEYAARGGKDGKGYKYAGSNNIDEVAWYDGNSGGETHPVGQKAPNELGLYDMTGNVWENMNNWHDDYNDSAKTNPVGPISGKYRVGRGGSWREGTLENRVSVRFVDTPGNRDDNCGLRLVLSPATEADTGGIWTSFYNDNMRLAGYMDKYSRVRIEPKFSRPPFPCKEFDNIIGVAEDVGEDWKGYYLTKAGKILGKDSLYVSRSNSVDCETEGFILFRDNKTNKIGLFDRNGKVVIPAEYDKLGKVTNGVITALKDAEEICQEESENCHKAGSSNMLIDTSNNVLIDDFPDIYNRYFDFFSIEKSKTPHPDTTVRESFPAKGGGYYSIIDIEKEFKRWLDNDLEAALKADILNPALKADKNNPDPKKLIGWHITDYWDHAIIDNNGKVYRQEFIVRNYDNLIREARKPDQINYGTFHVTGSDEDVDGHNSHYEYSRNGDGGYTLSYVTLRTDELILDMEVYSALGEAYFEGEYYKEAIVYFEKAIESDPDCADAYYAMEESGREKGEKPKWEKASGEAAKYFRDIIKPEPAKCAASFYGLGEAYMENNEESKGQAFKKKAEELGYIPD